MTVNTAGLRLFVQRAAAAKRLVLRRECEEMAGKITDWMRANAPWQDDTGNARASLEASVEETVDGFRIVLRGGDSKVDYMPFLEFAHSGRYAIIRPALEFWGPGLFEVVAGHLGGIR